jgi:hypothetical protein
MRHLNISTMISQARKAGLQTADFYPSLVQCPQHDGRISREGKAIDANGFVADYSPGGQPLYRPSPEPWPGR